MLCDLEPIVMAANGQLSHNQNFSELHCGMPVMSIGQEGRLDAIIAKLEDAASKNQLMNTVTSEVMELYEYKLAAMSHAERTAQGSLEAASSQMTGMNHRIALMSSELARLHGMLYTTQLSHEQLLHEKQSSTVRIAEVEINLKESHSRLQTERDKRMRSVNDLKSRLESTEAKLRSTLVELETEGRHLAEVTEEKKKLITQNTELSLMLEKYEERYKSYKIQVEDTEKALVQSRKQATDLIKDLELLEVSSRQKDKRLTDQQYELDKLREDCKDLEQMRELIVSISTKKRN